MQKNNNDSLSQTKLKLLTIEEIRKLATTTTLYHRRDFSATTKGIHETHEVQCGMMAFKTFSLLICDLIPYF